MIVRMIKVNMVYDSEMLRFGLKVCKFIRIIKEALLRVITVCVK